MRWVSKATRALKLKPHVLLCAEKCSPAPEGSAHIFQVVTEWRQWEEPGGHRESGAKWRGLGGGSREWLIPAWPLEKETEEWTGLVSCHVTPQTLSSLLQLLHDGKAQLMASATVCPDHSLQKTQLLILTLWIPNSVSFSQIFFKEFYSYFRFLPTFLGANLTLLHQSFCGIFDFNAAGSGVLTHLMMMGWTDGGTKVYLLNCNNTFILFK